MDISALSISLKISALWLECWNSAQDAFTALVVAGLVAEIFVVVVDWHEERVEFFEGILSPPKDPGISILIFGLTGAILVAVGVGGELWTHQRASIVEDDMQVTVEKLVALANKQAESAKTETAQLELENTRLRALIQPREISQGQRRSIRDALLQFCGHTVAVQVKTFADEEAYEFGLQIRDTLTFSGLNSDISTNGPSTFNGKWFSPPLPGKTGIEIEGPKNEQELERKLEWALRTIGGFKIVPPEQVPSIVTVVVLSKPLPDDGHEHNAKRISR